VLALVLVAALGVSTWLKMSQVEEAPAADQQPVHSPYRLAPMARTQRPTALFVGDDFPAGYEGYAYPYAVCDLSGLNCNVDAQSGTGFINDGRAYSTENSRLMDRLPRDRRIYNADLVIIDAGRNDVEAGPEAYGRAMEQYLTEITRLWPTARIVVIAPSHLSAEPDPAYADQISMIGRITASFGGVLIDPVAEGWYSGVDISTIESADHMHPNKDGYQLIAQRLGESLQRHGLVELRGSDR
jgi:lysophospholipase L1-like esterase